MDSYTDSADRQRESAVLLDREDGTSILYRGVLISSWRSWMHPELLVEAIRAVDVAAERHPEGLALVSIHQLDPRFPIGIGFTSNLTEIAQQLGRIRPKIRTLATVIEFDGFLAKTFRLAIRGVLAAGAPNLDQRVFTSRVEAVRWVGERAASVAGPDALRAMLEVARLASSRAED